MSSNLVELKNEKDANGEFVLNSKGKKIKYRVAVLSGTRIDK